MAGLLKNHKLALSLSDATLGRLLAFGERKVSANGGDFVQVDRFFASSKTCAACGVKRAELSLSERTFMCPACGFWLNWRVTLPGISNRANQEGVVVVAEKRSRQGLVMVPRLRLARTGHKS